MVTRLIFSQRYYNPEVTSLKTYPQKQKEEMSVSEINRTQIRLLFILVSIYVVIS